MPNYVLVTGADKGLGYALTERYLNKGFYVYACFLNEPGDKINALKEKYGNQLTAVKMDVTDESAVIKAAEEFSKISDSLELLINNAGVHFDASDNPLETADIDIAMKTLNINTLGPLRVNKAFLKFVEKGTMKVITNISSEAGSISQNWREKEYDYCMSKAALNMQSAILQKYVKPKGIKILAVHPGWMRTDMGGPTADIDASTAAEGISNLIDKYKGDLDGPMYMDYSGKLMTW